MSYSKGHNVNCNRVTLGGIFGDDSDTIDIVHSDPSKKILVNGVEPSAGGGGGVTDPLNLNNINAAVAMTTPSITPPAAGGGLVIKANGLIAPDGASEELNISARTIETNDGDISTNNGNVRVQGTGYISSATTITANGNISTGVAADIVSGRNLYFKGQDIYKSYEGVVPPIADQTYKEYKGLVGTGDDAIFTGEPVFRDTVKVQTTDGAVPPVLTDQITLNKNGTVQCSNANIGTQITCGLITCDNGGDNECRARVFNTRTSGTAGWNITQALEEANAPQNAANNILQFAATQAQAAGIPTQVYITASDFDPSQGDSPSIIFDPVTTASGGSVYSSQFHVGTTAGRYVLKQDVGGPLDQVLQVTAPSATGEVRFKDNVGGDTLVVKNAGVDLGSSIPLSFGLYSFRPQQYTLSQTGFPIEATANAFTKIFTSVSQWTNVNTGATGQAITEGFYKLSVSQTGVSSPANSYEGLGILCDFVYRIPADSLPNTQLPNPLSFSYIKYLTTGAPQIEIRRNATGGQDVHMTFPTSVTGGESMPLTVKLTKMDY